mgnify:CR=1 FL=1
MMLLDKTIVLLEMFNMTFLDGFMLLLFIGFMFFIFGGYHKEKYKKRKGQEED